MRAPPHVVTELPGAEASSEIRHFAHQSAWLISSSPYWNTSVLAPEEEAPLVDLHEEIETGLRARPVLNGTRRLDVDFIILHRLRPLRLPRRAIRIYRIHDFVTDQMWKGHGVDGTSRSLESVADEGYFACASEVIRESLVEHRPSMRHRAYIVPQALPILPKEDAASSAPPPAPYFIAVGPISARANYARLVEAFRHARERQESARHLVIVGENAGDAEAARAIESGVAEGWITWERRAGQARLIPLLRNAYALVAAPLEESLGLPALQAAALGVPSAVSDLRVFRTHFADAAEFFDPRDSASIASALLRLSTAQSRTHFAVHAPHRARTFWPENELAHWQELFRELGQRAEIPAVSPRRIVGWQPKKVESIVPLTVVMGTESVDDRIHAALERLVPQAAATGAEMLVGSLEPFPCPERYPAVRFLVEPGSDVLTLRARGASMARGEIIAITEDHGTVPEDWCARLIDEHRSHPEAAVVYGPVRHGGPFTITSWANFYAIFGLAMPPLDFPPRRKIPPIVNVSIKGSFAPAVWESGWFEFVGLPTLYDIGLCHASRDLVVDHLQHHGLFGTYWAHFHNARVTTGLRGLKRNSATWRAQFRDSLLYPWQSLAEWREIWRSPEPRLRLLAAFPAFLLIALTQALGEIVGLYIGPGDSAKYLD